MELWIGLRSLGGGDVGCRICANRSGWYCCLMYLSNCTAADEAEAACLLEVHVNGTCELGAKFRVRERKCRYLTDVERV